MRSTLRFSTFVLALAAGLWMGLGGPGTAHGQQMQGGASPVDVTLRGFVTDASTGQALPGANVVLLSPAADTTATVVRGTTADGDGFYQLADLSPGRYVLRVSYVGYRSFRDTLRLGDEAFVQQNARLAPTGEALEEVVVDVDDAGAAQLEAGLQKVRPKDLERIPTPGVGGDLATYLQSLPGVVSLGDRGGQLFIRGGTPDQNLVLVDGTLIYQPFHIVGFFSAFPQELVSSADLYAGGFDARYTGRISSVIDVQMRAGNKEHFAAGAQAGPFLASVRMEGPLTTDGDASIIGSLRRSLIEETAPALLGEEQSLKFSEAYLKVDHRGEHSNCGVTAMRTYDRGRIDADRQNVFRWSNTTIGGQCRTFSANSPINAKVRLGFSHFNNEVGTSARPERASSIWRINTGLDLSRPTGPHVTLRGGFRGRYKKLGYQLRERFARVPNDEDAALVKIGGYAGADLRFLDGALDLKPSVAVTAPFNYSRPSLEPRLRAAWRPFGNEAQQLSGALGLYRQTLVGISDERDAGSVFRAWLPTPVENEQAQALHAILGWRQRFGGGSPPGRRTVLGLDNLTVSVEGYYKRLAELPVPLWSSFARFTTDLGLADGDVYGFDLRLEGQRGPVYGYLGYGFSNTQYRFAQPVFGEAFGDPVQAYHPPHDQRHTLNAALSAEWGPWQTSARWQLGSGRPWTQPYGFDTQIVLTGLPDVRITSGGNRVLFERPYEARLPAYHRLDVSLRRVFDLGAVELTAEGGAINVYDRRNLFYYDVFSFDRVDQLPFIPYLSVKVATP